MSSGTKTDNHNPAAKLALRRHFLREYHAKEPVHVLDCFQAQGRLWSALQREFKVASYWGVDITPKKGRLCIDSARILDQPGWPQNVIDLDAYGSPWKHWFALLAHCDHDVTVFLTIGFARQGAGNQICGTLRSALGLTFEKYELPPVLGGKLMDLGIDACLAVALRRFEVVEAIEANNTKAGNYKATPARYIGLRLALKK